MLRCGTGAVGDGLLGVTGEGTLLVTMPGVDVQDRHCLCGTTGAARHDNGTKVPSPRRMAGPSRLGDGALLVAMPNARVEQAACPGNMRYTGPCNIRCGCTNGCGGGGRSDGNDRAVVRGDPRGVAVCIDCPAASGCGISARS